MNEERALTEKLAGDIARKYSIYSRMIKRVLAPFAKMTADPKDVSGAMNEIRQIVRMMDIDATRWAFASSKKAYIEKRKGIASRTEAIGNLDIGKRGNPEIAMKNLADKSAREFVKANGTIEGTCLDFLKTYEQAFAAVNTARVTENMQAISAAEKRQMETSVERMLARGMDEGAITRRLRDYLRDMMNGDDFIKIGERYYEIKYYAELVARETLHDCYIQATIDECEKWDNDLVQFSRHDDPCPLCAMLEGMVFSISGNDPDFPALDDPVEVEVMTGKELKTVQVDPKAPHPNCEHNLNPVTRNILRAAGELG